MLIKDEFTVAEPVEKVWRFFDDIPQVAACLPGTQLTNDLGGGRYEGSVSIRMGPVSLRFAGTANITERDDAAKRLVLEAQGADEKGRGRANMVVTASLVRSGAGTTVQVAQDLQVFGAAAQYGRGMISDVTSVLMRDFATNLENGIASVERGDAPARAAAAPASGFAVGLRAAMLALKRVFRRFFAPFQDNPTS